MKVDLPNARTAHLIGDPHLGRRFETGVPRHRQGEREARQMAHFIDELETNEHDYVIQVGDLFDNPYVSQLVVVSAARAAIAAAERNPHTHYIHMAGNHDKPRNLSAVGAWIAFTKMVQDRLPNLHVATYPTRIHNIVVFPWEWDRTAAEQLGDLAKCNEVSLVVGHWDLKSFGGDDSHIAPAEALKSMFPNAKLTSGHFHIAGEYVVEGHTIDCTGSMEPYTHAEDPSGDLYVTMSLEELEGTDPDSLKHKCVRVILPAGADLPELDCLALTHTREAREHLDTAEVPKRDWNSILKNAMKDLPTFVVEAIEERMPVDDPTEE